MDIIILAIFLGATWAIGCNLEKGHFKKIKEREIALIKHPFVTFGVKKWESKRKVRSAELVTGEVVVSGDYFKWFVASIKTLFGGRLTTYESILDRARREAILRMREKAKNADIIVNGRIETVMFNKNETGSTIPMCAIIAYGTAVTYE